MNLPKVVTIGGLALLFSTTVAAANTPVGQKGVPADRALTGVALAMTPDQLPHQFRTQLRGDVKRSHGIAILKREGNDVAYKFSWSNMTSSVISGHFHLAPHGQVGIRGYSICGVANESPPCPTGKSGSISGVWKNANLAAFDKGRVTIAFHTQVYPAPIGEIAAYIPASKDGYSK